MLGEYVGLVKYQIVYGSAAYRIIILLHNTLNNTLKVKNYQNNSGR